MVKLRTAVISSAFKYALVTIFIASILAGCSIDESPPPLVNVGPDRTVIEAEKVILNSTVSIQDGGILRHRWVQTNGRPVELKDVNGASAYFIAPTLLEDEQDVYLTFKLSVYVVYKNEERVIQDSVTLKVSNIDQPVTANAGKDIVVVQETNILLDASNSIDPDGSIEAYHWQQVQTGAPNVIINNANSMVANIMAPKVEQGIDFIFRLTVTNTAGQIGEDDVIVTIRPEGNINTHWVQGNISSFDSFAELALSLSTKPFVPVHAQVMSFLPEVSLDDMDRYRGRKPLVFNPDNWNQPQHIVLRRQANDPLFDKQRLSVIARLESKDKSYSPSPESAHSWPYRETESVKTGVDVEIFVNIPERINFLIAGSEATIQTEVTYNGFKRLWFYLRKAPKGMTINQKTGYITWIPPQEHVGRTFDITMEVTDGEYATTQSFKASIAKTLAIDSSMLEGKRRIADSTTDLNGLIMQQMSSKGKNDLSRVRIRQLVEKYIPDIPSRIVRFSDVFTLENNGYNEDTWIDFSFDYDKIPDGYSIRDLDLYKLVEYGESIDSEDRVWSPIFSDIEYRSDSSGNPIFRVKLDLLNRKPDKWRGVYFFGFQTATENVNAQVMQKGISIENQTITCETSTTPWDRAGDQYKEQTCTSTLFPEFEIFVNDFGVSADYRKWNIHIHELVSWVIEAHQKFMVLVPEYYLENEEYYLGNYAKKINIAFFDAPLGEHDSYVTPDDGRKTLYLNSNPAINVKTAKASLLHQYFYYAIAHLSHEYSMIESNRSEERWILAARAKWFEDYVDDDLDSYRDVHYGRILEKGLMSVGDALEQHQKVFVMKTISNKCFYDPLNRVIPQLTNPRYSDPGKQHFAEYFWQHCNRSRMDYYPYEYGKYSRRLRGVRDHLSPAPASVGLQVLDAMLLYYSHATLFAKKTSILDQNENDEGVRYYQTPYTFNPALPEDVSAWTDPASKELWPKLANIHYIPELGAYSFVVPAVEGTLPEGKIAELIVESESNLTVAITSKDPIFTAKKKIAGQPYEVFKSGTRHSYIYDSKGKIPELFVTMTNPSIVDRPIVKVFFRIRDKKNASIEIRLRKNKIITSRAVNHPVRRIHGYVIQEEESVDPIHTVVITNQHGIAQSAPVQENGIFYAKAMLSAGHNMIRYQGFNDQGPQTEIFKEYVYARPYEPHEWSLDELAEELKMTFGVVPAKVQFAVAWDTEGGMDIFSTDKAGQTIWRGEPYVGQGLYQNSKRDYMYPEIITYRVANDDSYIDNEFDLDIRYRWTIDRTGYDQYSKETANYKIYILLNEDDVQHKKMLKFQSIVPLKASSSIEEDEVDLVPPDEEETTYRLNNLITVACDKNQICDVKKFDEDRLQQVESRGWENTTIPKQPPNWWANNVPGFYW